MYMYVIVCMYVCMYVHACDRLFLFHVCDCMYVSLAF